LEDVPDVVETLRMLSSNVENDVKAYAIKRPVYDEFSAHLADLLRDLIRNAGVGVHAVEKRAKSMESFREKINRSGKLYANPLQDVSDLAGVRVILYYEEDVRKVCKLLEKEFIIERSQSVDKAKLLGEDQFGYLSVHYVVKLAKSRQGLPGWATYKELKAELQVRTVLQHAWAAFSHKLQYKKESQIPKQNRRRLVRLAGLLELADDEFSDLKKQLVATSRRNKRKLSQGIYGLEIDLSSATEYVRSSEVVARITSRFRKFGFQVNGQLDNANQLTSVAIGLRLPTIASLDSALKKSLAGLDGFLPMFIHKNFGDDKNKWRVFPVGGDPDHWAAVALLQSVAKDLDKHKARQLVPWSRGYIDTVLLAKRNR
jgi:putative GTP pyrophosphokinase